jgi:hypothetical protein
MARTGHVLIGVSAGATVLVASTLLFGPTLLRCRAENQTHHPALCSPSDRHPNVLFFGAAAVSLVIAAAGLPRFQARAIRLVARIATVTYAVFVLLVFTT